MQQHKFSYLLLLIMLLPLSELFAQEKSSITGTSLKIKLLEGYKLDENSSAIIGSDFCIDFMEMNGVSFEDTKEDFDSIEYKFALKGIEVENKEFGKMGGFDALLISLNSKPSIYQVLFGNDNFCAFANVISNDTFNIVDQEKALSLLNTIEFVQDNRSALVKHGNFTVKNYQKDWNFEENGAMSNMFLFEHKETEDGIMILQLPPESLLQGSEKQLMNEFVGKYKTQFPNLRVIEEGKLKVKGLNGYKSILAIEEEGGHLELFYMLVFGNNKSAFVFQGMGKKNDEKTIKLFESFLKNFSLKE